MNDQARKYIESLQAMGPIAWAEGAHGWIENGQLITLEPWQRAALTAYWENRETVSTFAISNVKKTGKTFTNAILTAFRWLAYPGQHFTAGNDLDQSQARQFAMIAEMVKNNPFLAENCKVGKSEILFTLTGSKLTALASDATGNAGANFLTSSHTEVWGVLWENSIRSFEELTPPPGKTYGLPSLRIVDGYAGFLGESHTWHKIVDRGLAGKRLPGKWPIYQAGGLLLFHMEGQEAQEKCFRGSDAERKEYYTEQAETLRPNSFSRMHNNIRTEGESAFITPEQWQACYDPNLRPNNPGDKRKMILGADASTSHDLTALVGSVYNDETGKVEAIYTRVWKPRKLAGIRFGKATIDLDETIGEEVIRLYQAGQVQAVVCDPYQLHTLILKWTKAGIKVIELAQNAGRVQSDQALYTAITGGAISHYNDPDLSEHVKAAVAIETPRGYRLAKEKASKKIDLAVSLSMSHWGALEGKNVIGESAALLDPWNCSYEDIYGRPYLTPEQMHDKLIADMEDSLGITARREQAEAEEFKRTKVLQTFYKNIRG